MLIIVKIHGKPLFFLKGLKKWHDLCREREREREGRALKAIPYTRPSITEKEVAYANDAAANGWGAHCYDYIQRFESAFAAHLGVRHVVATSSCTGALTLGLAALGIQTGDEIIIPDTTWIASVAPIVQLGAVPVFVDIDEKTWCIDPSKIESAITPKTRAILAVHLYGNVCALDELLKIAKRHHLFLIEDAAEALGSSFNGKPCGALGMFSTFSFHGTKTITTGEGGLFATNDSALYEKVLTLSNHGRARDVVEQFYPVMIGYKFKMANINAAIGLAQLERRDELFLRKREILHFYKNALLKFSGIELNDERSGTINGAWMPSVVFDESLKITQAMILSAFQKENIDARVFFRPLSSLPMFADCPQNIVAHSIFKRAINLPSFHDMTDDDQNRVVGVIAGLLK